MTDKELSAKLGKSVAYVAGFRRINGLSNGKVDTLSIEKLVNDFSISQIKISAKLTEAFEYLKHIRGIRHFGCYLVSCGYHTNSRVVYSLYSRIYNSQTYLWNTSKSYFEVSQHFDWGNFISYAKKAQKIKFPNKIKSQTKRHWNKLEKLLKI